MSIIQRKIEELLRGSTIESRDKFITELARSNYYIVYSQDHPQRLLAEVAYEVATKLLAQPSLVETYGRATLILTGLFYDLCSATHPDWRRYKGHGSRTMYILHCFFGVNLHKDAYNAIRNHMQSPPMNGQRNQLHSMLRQFGNIPWVTKRGNVVQDIQARLNGLNHLYEHKLSATFTFINIDGNKCLLSDSYGYIHPYVLHENEYQKAKIGETICARIRGVFSGKTDVCLDLLSTQSQLPLEDETTELKSSFAHTAGEDGGLDAQMSILTQVIASFMNTNGGKLYIGVKDDGTIRGIDDDLKEINNTKFDLKTTYNSSLDGFEQKLKQTIIFHLGAQAVQYIDTIRFIEDDSKNYVVVVVKPAKPTTIYHNEKGRDRDPRIQNNTIYIRNQAGKRIVRTVNELEDFFRNRYSTS